MLRLLSLIILVLVTTACDLAGSGDVSDRTATRAVPGTTPPAPTPPYGGDLIERLGVATFPPNAPYRPWQWSPDGASIAYIGRDYGVYVADAPDFRPRRLAPGPASEPRWSPDGKLVAFALQDEGIAVALPSLTDSAFVVSPPDDMWRQKIMLIHRWLDDDTIAYQIHCGTGCALLYELTLARPDAGPPTSPGTLREVPVVNEEPYPQNAGTLFHYSDDGRFIVADYGGWPQVAWYDSQTGERWHITFDDDPPFRDAPGVMRAFVRWDANGAFVYRQAAGPEEQATWHDSSGLPFAGTYWLADPATRTVTPLPKPPPRGERRSS